MIDLVRRILQVKTTSPKKYCVRPNTGVVPPNASIEVTGEHSVPVSQLFLSYVERCATCITHVCIMFMSDACTLHLFAIWGLAWFFPFSIFAPQSDSSIFVGKWF